MKPYPHLNFEEDIWAKGQLACGIDEVGRGCFAGPLVVGAVILKPVGQNTSLTQKLLSLGIHDSKLLSPLKRERIYALSQEFIKYSFTHFISVEKINKIGIGEANKEGFKVVSNRAQKLTNESIFFLTDAFPISGIETLQQKNIIHGDATSISIALASIIAKVERDNFMKKISEELPSYGFEKHKGYGTLYHRMKIQELGPSIHHRTQFIQGYI